MYDLHVPIIMISDTPYTSKLLLILYREGIHSITLNILFHYDYRHNNNTILDNQ